MVLFIQILLSWTFIKFYKDKDLDTIFNKLKLRSTLLPCTHPHLTTTPSLISLSLTYTHITTIKQKVERNEERGWRERKEEVVVATTLSACMMAFQPPVAAEAVEENDLRVGNSNSTSLESSTVKFRDWV